MRFGGGANFGRGVPKKIPADYNFCNFCGSRHSEGYTLDGRVNFFWPYAPHFMSYLSEILCGISARAVLAIYEFGENRQLKALCSSYGCEWDHSYVLTMKPYDISEAKNVRVMSVYCITERTIYNLVIVCQNQTLRSKFLTQALPYIVPEHSEETICT